MVIPLETPSVIVRLRNEAIKAEREIDLLRSLNS